MIRFSIRAFADDINFPTMFPDENARLVDTVPTKLRKQETNLQIENTHLVNIHIFKFKTDEVTPVARLGNNTALHGHS